MPIREAIIATALILGSFSAGQSSAPRFVDLSRDAAARLDQQRAVVASTAKTRYGVSSLTKTKGDLPILQRMIDDKVFGPAQAYELQCLGVVFGDVLASEFRLRWVMVTDEYGTGPTLRLKNTSIQVNALTMISKRVERGEPVSLSELVRMNRQHIARIQKTQK